MAHETIPATSYDEKGEFVILDSMASPDYDRIKGDCEANDWDIPEVDSDEYWEHWHCILDSDLEIFRDSFADLGLVVMRGKAGLWYGDRDCGNVARVENGDQFLAIAMHGNGVDDCRVYFTKEQGLCSDGYHHDGTNSYAYRQLTEKGKELYTAWENYEIELNERDLHEKLWQPEYSTKIDWFLDT